MKKEVETEKNSVQETFSDLKERVEDVYENAGDLVQDKLKEGKKLIKKYPVESVLVGFALGCLVGVCLTRRR